MTGCTLWRMDIIMTGQSWSGCCKGQGLETAVHHGQLRLFPHWSPLDRQHAKGGHCPHAVCRINTSQVPGLVSCKLHAEGPECFTSLQQIPGLHLHWIGVHKYFGRGKLALVSRLNICHNSISLSPMVARPPWPGLHLASQAHVEARSGMPCAPAGQQLLGQLLEQSCVCLFSQHGAGCGNSGRSPQSKLHRS